MITKYSQLHTAGNIKEKLIRFYERQIPPDERDKVTFEKWYADLDSVTAKYTDVPVKTWDNLYHEETQPWKLDYNLRNLPEE